MRLRLLCAAALLLGCLPSYADPVTLNPGDTVNFSGTYGTGTFGGTQLATTSGTNTGGKFSYSDSVYADPGNPFCAGCLDFVLQVENNNPRRVGTSIISSDFNGDVYSLAVAYDGRTGNTPPDSASEGKGGNRVTFDFSLLFPDQTDSLIIYTNALSYTDGTIRITTDQAEIDPAGFAPSGPAVVAATPEPSSLMLLGTGVLGTLGIRRRRTA